MHPFKWIFVQFCEGRPFIRIFAEFFLYGCYSTSRVSREFMITMKFKSVTFLMFCDTRLNWAI